LRAEKQGNRVTGTHDTLGTFSLAVGPDPQGKPPPLLFTENETNSRRLWGIGEGGGFVKDAFHDYVIRGRGESVNAARVGSKAAAHYVLTVPAGGTQTVRLRLCDEKSSPEQPLGDDFERIFSERINETDEFFRFAVPCETEQGRARRGAAGLRWAAVVEAVLPLRRRGLAGRRSVNARSARRPQTGRNAEWKHLFSRDIISMPDKWEYPWLRPGTWRST